MTQGLEVSSRSFSEIMAYMHGNILEIPPYQREYDWELEHVSLLIRDIYEHYSIWKDLDTSKKRHKQAGTIILHHQEQGSPRYIIDGQQRITTLTVIACALRDILEHAFEDNPQNLIYDEQDDIIWGLNAGMIPNPEIPEIKKTVIEIITVLKNMIHMITDASLVNLKLKQLDRERLEWIRKPITEKKSELCFDTFEWRKSKGSAGFPGIKNQAKKLAPIYLTYMKVWDIFGLVGKEEGVFENIGIKDCKTTVINAKVTNDSVFPFANAAGLIHDKDKKSSWTYVSEVSKVRTSIEKISQFVFSMSELTHIIELKVTDQWQAYQIFERTNSSGMKLGTIDVIRARLWSQLDMDNNGSDAAIKADEEELLETMELIYSEKPNKTDIKLFVSHYATVLNESKITGSAAIKKLYLEEIENLDTRAKVLTWSKALVDNFNLYYSVFVKFDNEDFKDTTLFSKIFSTIGFKQHRPIILKALIEKLDDEHISKLHEFCESMYIMQLMVANGSPSEIETLMAEQIGEINPAGGVDDVIDKMVDKYKNTKTFTQNGADTLPEFTKKLKITKFSNNQGHFILRKKLAEEVFDLYKTRVGMGAPTAKISDFPGFQDPTVLQLEHILPEKPKHWGNTWWNGNEATDAHKEYYQRIGNMVLLTAEANKKVGIKPFPEKKIIYTNDCPSLTADITPKSHWNKSEIDVRTHTMVNYMKKWWKF